MTAIPFETLTYTGGVYSVQEEIDYEGGEEIYDVVGNLIWLKGHPYPWKGLPTIAALNATNQIKYAITHGKKIPWEVMEPYINEFPNQRLAITLELYDFLHNFMPRRKALSLAFIVEYDSAYRFRLLDLMREKRVEDLFKRPIREIWRLVRINGQRDSVTVHRKVVCGAVLLMGALLWPPFRAKWRSAFRYINWYRFLPDEGDLYWMRQRKDYKYEHRISNRCPCGKNIENLHSSNDCPIYAHTL